MTNPSVGGVRDSAIPVDGRLAILLRRVAVASLLALALLWPLAVNRTPVLFTDSFQYLALGRLTWNGVDQRLRHVPKRAAPQAAPPPLAVVGPPAAMPSAVPHKFIHVGGRSIYFSVFAELARRVAGWWTVVFVTALWIGAAILLALWHFGLSSPGKRAAAIIVLGSATTLPFFTVVVMPDVYAGIVLLACVMLLGFARDMARSERVFWVASLIVALVFHKAFLILGMAILPVGLLVFRASRSAVWLTIGALAVGLVATLAAQPLITRIYGAPTIEPPFLLARTMGDGTLASVLRDDCPRRAHENCRFVGELPLTGDQYLWPSVDKPLAWSALPTKVRQAVADEQVALVAEVFMRYPLTQAARSASNSIEQLGDIEITDFKARPDTEISARQTHFDREWSEYVNSAIWRGGFPLGSLSRLWTATYELSIVVAVAGLIFRRRLFDRADPRLMPAAFVLITGVLFNAIINGGVSGTFGRYQGRISWLATLAALIVVSAALDRFGGVGRRGAHEADGTTTALAA